ncbi:unnamed protein product [Arctogadus glacialis]
MRFNNRLTVRPMILQTFTKQATVSRRSEQRDGARWVNPRSSVLLLHCVPPRVSPPISPYPLLLLRRSAAPPLCRSCAAPPTKEAPFRGNAGPSRAASGFMGMPNNPTKGKRFTVDNLVEVCSTKRAAGLGRAELLF